MAIQLLKTVSAALFSIALLACGTSLAQENPNDPDVLARLTAITDLVKSSSDVILVHLTRDSCQLSASERIPIDRCEGVFLQKWKGLASGPTVAFSLPASHELISRAAREVASRIKPGALHVGGRYLLFLRYATDGEPQFTPKRPWTADVLQSALMLDDSDKVQAVFADDPLSEKLCGMETQDLLDSLEEITHAGSMDDAYRHQKIEEDYCCSISWSRLEDVGIHLPSYLPSVIEQEKYQASLSSHQELTLEWESLPGIRGPGMNGAVEWNEVKNIPFAPNFSLISAKKNLRNGPRVQSGYQFIFVGVTSHNEIHGLQFSSASNIIAPDLPKLRGDTSIDKAFVIPKLTFQVVLPDDPEIRTVLILRPRMGTNGGHWELFAKIELNSGSVEQ